MGKYLEQFAPENFLQIRKIPNKSDFYVPDEIQKEWRGVRIKCNPYRKVHTSCYVKLKEAFVIPLSKNIKVKRVVPKEMVLAIIYF